MKTYTQSFVLLMLAVLLSANAQAAMNVFACEPEWGALAKNIGGDKVNVYNATTAMQDPHHIEARPSLIAKARQADLLVCTGAELEIGWLPLLLKKSGNAAIQQGQAGYFMATDHVTLLEKLDHVDRSMGDVHAAGNPHIQTDPRLILKVADALAQRMQQIDASHATVYQQNHAAFSQRWQAAMQKWQSQAQILQNTPVVVHHNHWVYLNNWLGLQQVTTLEPKPGVPPSGSHLSSVLQQLKQKPAKLVIYASFQNPRSANWLAQKANIPAVKLPATVGGTSEAKDLFSFFDDIIARLLAAKG
ncbi:MAG TPA: zinc ABC transporter substrate-binding protein [Thiothrix sp.]|nr:zinc ABC transporter substrate-binding protein [Thiothrix sp.]